jgi:hypothetical protein
MDEARMKIHIDKHGTGLYVRIEGAAGREQALLEAIRLCRQSAWACQLGDCMNVESIAESVAEGVVCLTLIARPGIELEPSAVEQCLRLALPAAVKT